MSNYEGGSIKAAGLSAAGLSAAGLDRPKFTPKEMYHKVLSLGPREFEFMREYAAQMLGAKPSEMWDHLPLKNSKQPLKSAAEHYQHIMNMPNSHALGKLIAAEASNGEGGGFNRAVNHVFSEMQPYMKKVYQPISNVHIPPVAGNLSHALANTSGRLTKS